jgi:hypothetical protein
MRVALISDLHGNAIALETALRDIEAVGVDRTVCLGDTTTLGTSPREVLAMLRDRQIPCIEGNHDAFLLDPALVQTYSNAPPIVGAIDWCRDELSAADLAFVKGFVPYLPARLHLVGTSALR